MTSRLRLAIRDWDWVTPLILGETDLRPLQSLGVDLDVTRVPALPSLWDSEPFDVAEASLSQYVLHKARGDDRVHAVPHMLMQAFRQRCIIVGQGSPLTSVEELRGTTVGLTGWADSGSVWTRAVLAEAGIGVDDADWVVGRLTPNHDHHDRLGGYGEPGHIMSHGAEETLLGMLDDGRLSAVMTPFMPPGFNAPDAPWRPLLPDVRAAEIEYAGRVGYVPGMHVLAFNQNVDPEVVVALSDVLQEAKRAWRVKRSKYAETSMWLACDLYDEARFLPNRWDEPSLDAQSGMLRAFLDLQLSQRLLPTAPSLNDLFADLPGSASHSGGEQ